MSIRNAQAGTIRAALRYPAFRSLLAGLAVSQLGDWLYNLALVALVYERTDSVLWAGVTTAARVVPIVALGPLGGVVADRFDRRAVMVACDLIRLVLMAALALVAAASLPIVVGAGDRRRRDGRGQPVPALRRGVHATAGPRRRPAGSQRRPVRRRPAWASSSARRIGGVLLLLGSPALAFLVNAAHVRPVRPRRAGDPGRRGLPAAARRTSSPPGCCATWRHGAAVLRAQPAGAAAGRRRHHVQPGLRDADRAAHPGRPAGRARPARLRLPVRQPRRWRP